MLIPIIGDLSISIKHVGSTSIDGLSAKSIIDIDIDVVMESYSIFSKIKERLENAGYKHKGDLGIEGREAFKNLLDQYLIR